MTLGKNKIDNTVRYIRFAKIILLSKIIKTQKYRNEFPENFSLRTFRP